MPHKDTSGNTILPNRNLEILFPFPNPERQIVAAHTLSGIKKVIAEFPETELGVVCSRRVYREAGNPPTLRLWRNVPLDVEVMMPGYLRNPVSARMEEMLLKLGFKPEEFMIQRMDYS